MSPWGRGGGKRRGYCPSDDGKELCPSKAMEWQSLQSSGKSCGFVGETEAYTKANGMHWIIMGLGEEVLMKSVTQGYLGNECSGCQVVFQGHQKKLRVFMSLIHPSSTEHSAWRTRSPYPHPYPCLPGSFMHACTEELEI